MKKLSTLLFFIVLSLTVWGYDFQVDQLCYNILSGNEVEVTYEKELPYSSDPAYSSLSGDIIIPKTVTYDGTIYTVTSIGERAFYDCSSLTSVIIPVGVTSIGYSTFNGCTSLASVTIPNTVTSIEAFVFSACPSLTNIQVESGNPSYSSENGVLFNADKTILVQYPAGKTETTYTIPNSVTSIGAYAFYGCSSLTSVTIPEGVTSIGDQAFYGCSSLTSVIIPEGVTSIGDRAFSDCSSLTSVTIPVGVTSIGYSTFNGCTSLASVTIPNTVTSIEAFVFSACPSLTNIQVESGNPSYSSENGVLFNADKTILVQYPAGKTETTYTIPNSVTSIGDQAFGDCSSLTSVIIPEGVTNIGAYAFYGCSFASITIPSSVTSIGDGAFEFCQSLNEMRVLAAIPPAIGNDVFSYDIIIFVPKQSYDAYLASNWQQRYVSFQSNYDFYVDGFYYALLSGNENKVEITNYEHNPIGGNSTYPSLSGDIIIPSSVNYNETTYTVTSIGESAFMYCSSLTSITIPNSVATIEDSAFDFCRSLSFVTIPNSVTSIGKFAFRYCSSLTSIAIPNSVTSIGDGAFTICSSLTDIQVAYDNLSYISENGVLFSVDKTDLVQYPAGKTETSYIIPHGVTSIEHAAFAGCSSLGSITIPNSVTIIGSYAFFDCPSLSSITIPNSVVSIEFNAFEGTTDINEMTVLATIPPTANSSSLNGVVRSIPLYVPAASIEAYRIADGWKEFTNILPVESLTHKQLEVTITGNGIIQYGETTLTEDGTLYIEPETEVSLKLLPDDGFEIVQVMYNGTDYSSNVNDEGILTLPVMEENASLDVSFQPIDTSNELCITDANQRVVFFKAPQSYNSDVYVYMWKDNGFVGEYELTPFWPGTKAISQGDGYYRFYIPESWGEPEADWMIIWSDGKGSGHLDGQQTEDLPFTMRALYAGSSFMDTRETGIVGGLCDEGEVQHLATIYIEGGEGNIQFGETQISSGTTMLIPSNGTFTLTAPAGYSIMTATVNGEAFYEVENGQSVVVSNITGDIDLYVTLESLHYRMSVYYEGSTVYTWYRVGYMMDFTCNIVAMEGYQLQSVTLNGEDVTSLLDSEGRLDITNITEDKTLIISSSQNGGTTNYVSSDMNRLRAWQAGENIFVEVDETVQSVMLYDVTGRLMQEYQHMGGYQVITMPVKNLVNLLKVVGKDGSVVSHKLM